LQLGAVLAWFWRLRGYLREGRGWLEAVLSACPDVSILRSKVLTGAVLLTNTLGNDVRVIELAEEGVRIARKHRDASAIGWALHALGRALHRNKQYEQAAAALEESLTRFRTIGDLVGSSYSSWYLGNALREQYGFEQAAALFTDAFSFAQRAGDKWAMASSLLQAGILAYKQYDLQLASTRLKESMAHFRDIRAPWGMWHPLVVLIAVTANQGYARRTVCLAGAEQALRTMIGSVMHDNRRRDYDDGLATARATLSESAFAAAWAKGQSMSTEQAVDYALSSEDEV
jgi:non-specific serine/threonine protein kinase